MKSDTNNCRSIVMRREPNFQRRKSQLAYFINITINNKNFHDPLANLRFKIPKFLAKTVKKNHPSNNIVGDGEASDGDGDSDSDGNNKNIIQIWRTSRNLFPNKVKSFLTDVVGAKDPGIPSLSEVFGATKKDISDSDVSRNRELSGFYFDQNDLDDLEFYRTESLSSRSSTDSLNIEEYFVNKSPWGDANQNRQQICLVCRQRLTEVDLEKENFKNFKRVSDNMRGKRSIADEIGNDCRMGELLTRKLEVSQESGSDRDRNSDRGSWNNNHGDKGEKEDNKLWKKVWKKAWSNNHDDDDHGKKEDNKELCKKRILMGKRCRPLNLPDFIHYDENGNQIPEFRSKPSSF
ncbi:hypothetical protein NE237_028483 [Protea cynaroides]|uniref:Uncharacterized protein n=1 Tax=Protea cynaroides TaxID=273540 RepID=A0A9Q0GPG4_9MAGN|nr:hypothetical protein NE237_028483 [Protea cynaroides]